MKTIFKVLGLVFGLGAVILLVFHLVLIYGMTKAMREVVLPEVKKQTGIDVEVGRLSINVASGQLFLNDLEVRNPEGFLLENLASVERVAVELDVVSLVNKKPYHIKLIEVNGALLNVIRNQDGEINLNKIQEPLMQRPRPETKPAPEVERPVPESRPQPRKPVPEEQPVELPEMIFDKLVADATVRYIDLKLNELDYSLKLKARGLGISTLKNEAAAWGKAGITGSLGTDGSRFRTDLKLLLAPVRDVEQLSFDLTGTIMEIDPKIMGKAYQKLNITSDPFGIDPKLHSRFGRFQQSNLGIHIRNVRLDEKRSGTLRMGAIDLLKFDVPVKGTLEQPVIDAEGALKSAIANNMGSILDAFLKGAAAKEAGLEELPESMTDAVVEVLGEHVEEIGKNEAVKKVLKDLADGVPSATNAPAPISSDSIVDILGEEIDEIGENEALKDELKSLGKWLFGQ